jgi:hypothetical protein
MATSDRDQGEVQALVAGRLRLEFFKLGDRIAHRVLIAAETGWQPVLESVEGEADRACPPSPVLQQIQRSRIESDRQRGDAVVLLGAAGANHWSLCASLDAPPDDRDVNAATTDQLCFDVACRCRAPLAWIGTTYRVSPSISVAADGDLVFHGRRVRVRPLALGANVEFNSCQTHRRDGVIELTCLAPTAPPPTTIRWRYSIDLLA